MQKLIVILATVVFTVSGCTTDAFTGEKKVSNTGKGAGIGASVAAVAAYVANRNVDAKTRKTKRRK